MRGCPSWRSAPQTRALVTGRQPGNRARDRHRRSPPGARRVGLVSRGAEGLEALAAELGDRAIAVPADVADREADRDGDRLLRRAGGRPGPAGRQRRRRALRAVLRAGSRGRRPDGRAPTSLGRSTRCAPGSARCSTAAAGHVVVVSSGAALRGLPLGRRLRRRRRPRTRGSPRRCATSSPAPASASARSSRARWQPSSTPRPSSCPTGATPSDAIGPEEVARPTCSTAVEEDRREVHVPRQVRLLALNDDRARPGGPAAGCAPGRLARRRAATSSERRGLSSLLEGAPQVQRGACPTVPRASAIQPAASSSGSGRSS